MENYGNLMLAKRGMKVRGWEVVGALREPRADEERDEDRRRNKGSRLSIRSVCVRVAK